MRSAEATRAQRRLSGIGAALLVAASLAGCAGMREDWVQLPRDVVEKDKNKTPDKPGLKEELAKLEGDIKKASDDLKALAFFVLPKTSEETGYATPTPTSDGQRVYVALA